MTHDELTSVVAAGPKRGPRKERGELRIPEGHRGQIGADGRNSAIGKLGGEQTKTERCANFSSRAVRPAEA